MVSVLNKPTGGLMARRHFMRISGIALTSGLTGSLLACSNSDPNFYTLMPYPGQVFPSGRGIIEVRTPSLPLSLDRDRIVEQQANYALRLDETASWSEPLNVMIGGVIAQNLRMRLPSTTVFSQNDATTTIPQIYVELAINRFAKNETGLAELAGTFAVYKTTFKGGIQNKPVFFTFQPVGPTMTELVAALSACLGKISDEIAAQVVNI